MVAGIVVTHGNLANELLDTARNIVGDFKNCTAISNKGKSTTTLYEDIAATVDDDTPCILFVDFLGGSCGHGCLRVMAERPNTRLLSGVNLPMLLAFLNKRDEVPFEKLPAAITDRGRDAIRVVDPESL